MDLSTEYLGFHLPHPLMAGASPLSQDLDAVRRLEDAGAAAIVMSSLFEEDLVGEQISAHYSLEASAESFPEALSYLPSRSDLAFGPEEYLDQLRAVKDAVSIPVVGSLNGTTAGGWLEYATAIAQAGADAIELNVYRVVSDLGQTAQDLETTTLEMLELVLAEVNLPVAVKLSPFYTSLPNFAACLDRAGVNGLVLFNRFFQPDIDVDSLEILPKLHLSDSTELLLRVHALAILSGRISASLAVTGGVHTEIDAIKAIMAGAHGVQMVSALLQKGPNHLQRVRQKMVEWMEEREYESLKQMHGSMNFLRCPDPKALERSSYMQTLRSWKQEPGRM